MAAMMANMVSATVSIEYAAKAEIFGMEAFNNLSRNFATGRISNFTTEPCGRRRVLRGRLPPCASEKDGLHRVQMKKDAFLSEGALYWDLEELSYTREKFVRGPNKNQSGAIIIPETENAIRIGLKVTHVGDVIWQDEVLVIPLNGVAGNP